MKRIEDILLAAIAAAFGIYVLIRAWNIPVTVDECSTAVSHVPRAVLDTLFFQTDANPNNHILNTLLIKALTGIFGWHPMVVRTPALCGAFLYACSGLLLSRAIARSTHMRVFVFVMLLAQPYFLEFFSVARGYALGLGLMLTAIWQAWRFLTESRRANLHWAVAAAGLAVYANFTQILFFIPFISLLFLGAWQANPSFSQFGRKSGWALLILGIWGALIVTPLKRVSEHSEVQNWNPLGSLFESVEKSMRAAIGQNPFLENDSACFLAWLVTILTVGISLLALKKWIDARMKIAADPRIFVVFLLPGTLIVNVLQVKFTHTPYLEPRLALLYWPLFALALGGAAAWICERSVQWARAFMFPLVLAAILNLAKNANLRESFEWWHDRDTYLVLDYLKQVQQTEGIQEPLSLDVHGAMQNSFIFHLDLDPRGFNRIARLGPWHPNRPPTEEYEFYYAISEDEAKPILQAYDIVWRASVSPMVLLRRKK